MTVRKVEETKESNPLIGRWYISEMEMWDEDYFNLETQAYVEIKANNQGSFQFGLVTINFHHGDQSLFQARR